ncbi:c-type cytochrome [Allopusillimonas ginsengisoli]|uniref:c-type cytochrome n=1 Tax=Allopusillimonas ginsengisoli TaxID=453575 RepID=UPI001021F08F|nr:c-type cytochrome [Allopusillimonas ginsengisoli]TEA77138.1 c-type cytochrome [Allopusillimonas ginsengisoli]
MKPLFTPSAAALFRAAIGLALCCAASPAAFAQQAAATADPSATAKDSAPAKPAAPAFTPVDADAIPDGPFGETVRQGQNIFLHTSKYAKEYVGNALNCASCHLDAGRQKNSAPLWAAYVLYPAYRDKNKHVNTLAERLQGCFQYSMNGAMPPADSETIVALESYMYWLAQGAPTGVKLEGQGYPELDKPASKPDYTRGKAVFAQHCALCHGADGAGQKANGKMVFPALWGDESFNWGAGMHSVANAASFIKHNMPLGQGNTLTDQQAWDVAYYMNSHDRPQDPRFNGSVEETRKAFHDTPNSLYGQTVNGKVLGENATPPGGVLRDKKQG